MLYRAIIQLNYAISFQWLDPSHLVGKNRDWSRWVGGLREGLTCPLWVFARIHIWCHYDLVSHCILIGIIPFCFLLFYSALLYELFFVRLDTNCPHVPGFLTHKWTISLHEIMLFLLLRFATPFKQQIHGRKPYLDLYYRGSFTQIKPRNFCNFDFFILFHAQKPMMDPCVACLTCEFTIQINEVNLPFVPRIRPIYPKSQVTDKLHPKAMYSCFDGQRIKDLPVNYRVLKGPGVSQEEGVTGEPWGFRLGTLGKIRGITTPPRPQESYSQPWVGYHLCRLHPKKGPIPEKKVRLWLLGGRQISTQPKVAVENKTQTTTHHTFFFPPQVSAKIHENVFPSPMYTSSGRQRHENVDVQNVG